MAHRKAHHRSGNRNQPDSAAGTLRIIGGRLGGRQIPYLGDPRTRPMKQRVREAAFNLIGSRAKGSHVVDLFAGTGALAWEALSRGASSATLIERHFPTARQIGKTAAELGVASQVELVTGDTFVWLRKLQPEFLGESTEHPWLVFCSPPYELYLTDAPKLLTLLQTLADAAPPTSLIVVEADGRFDMQQLPSTFTWDVRTYPPAVLAVGHRGPE